MQATPPATQTHFSPPATVAPNAPTSHDRATRAAPVIGHREARGDAPSGAPGESAGGKHWRTVLGNVLRPVRSFRNLASSEPTARHASNTRPPSREAQHGIDNDPPALPARPQPSTTSRRRSPVTVATVQRTADDEITNQLKLGNVALIRLITTLRRHGGVRPDTPPDQLASGRGSASAGAEKQLTLTNVALAKVILAQMTTAANEHAGGRPDTPPDQVTTGRRPDENRREIEPLLRRTATLIDMALNELRGATDRSGTNMTAMERLMRKTSALVDLALDA